jgi:hypothetical protein
MADSLGLRFQPEVSKEGRAGRLRQRLKTEKKMLIILDDVWKRIELEEIGVPFDDDHRGCKILLTTRLEHVCSSMKCQQKVFLRVLPEDEALVLLLELDDGLNVPERFFEGMEEIEVLSLKGGCLSLQSLELSTKLQLLLLMECECKDLISLRKLQGLKILGLMSCLSIEELPDEIGELKELRLLDVTGCQRLRRIPVNLIGRLKKLEELLIGQYSFQGWDVVGCDSTGGMNANLTELNSLSNLVVLSVKIPKLKCIPEDFVFPRLLKYEIIFGNGYSAKG